ncbi:MAG TPA: MraY family glycosyltransferase [Candidatus Dependentiae bacterium]|nr:MraY family glycosyltransferase [Candidatus Dependentiae bacterium]HRQ62980.1 MraY family glycosyltransferase [Candidatus Dependentiae bacterium]
MVFLYIKVIFAFSFSLLVTFYIIPIFRSIALRFGLVDNPNGTLKRHKEPTPYLGGVAIYCGFLSSLVFTVPFENNMFLFFVGITLLLFVGLTDDLAPLKPHQKLFGQCLAAFCFLKSGFYLKEHIFYNCWSMPISFLWIMTIINGFNLVDVMDGLATALAIMASISFFIIALILHNWAVAILLASFTGALVAFLWYNRPPAHMYLGDAGALWVGGFLATVPFLINWGTYQIYGFVTPVIVLGIVLLEVLVLIVVRTWKGIPFYQGSPDHFCIYLQEKGWSKYNILLYISILSAILGIISVLFVLNIITIHELLLFGGIIFVMWFFLLLKKG